MKSAGKVVSEHDCPCPAILQPPPYHVLLLPLPSRKHLLIGRVSGLVCSLLLIQTIWKVENAWLFELENTSIMEQGRKKSILCECKTGCANNKEISSFMMVTHRYGKQHIKKRTPYSFIHSSIHPFFTQLYLSTGALDKRGKNHSHMYKNVEFKDQIVRNLRSDTVIYYSWTT